MYIVLSTFFCTAYTVSVFGLSLEVFSSDYNLPEIFCLPSKATKQTQVQDILLQELILSSFYLNYLTIIIIIVN